MDSSEQKNTTTNLTAPMLKTEFQEFCDVKKLFEDFHGTSLSHREVILNMTRYFLAKKDDALVDLYFIQSEDARPVP